ncbi:MAG: dihydroorotate dehydrogenase electron transfer subunit [Clostridiales bacterium]|nr:dihydroorotate dehydrogenase electron transfer subunit [Clostridiales bacterium]
MPIQRICKLLTTEELAPGIISQTLEAGGMAEQARPGQFVNLSCGAGLLLRRPISICDVEGETLRIAFQVKGEGTRYLAALRPGDEVDVLGPLGHGWEYPKNGKILVVGGGIGVPPMLYTAKQARHGAVAAVGFRTAALEILTEDFEAAGCPVRIASDDGTVGYHGFVNALVTRELEADKSISCVMACGPKPMLKSVYLAAKEQGVPCQVSMEERMGCGIGACLVCACSVGGHNRHVCKDGPVFRAEEVDWA